jgi:hypothetical protein
MIYRSPERKPALGRMASSRELALWLVVLASLAAGVLTLANIPGQPLPPSPDRAAPGSPTPDAALEATRRAPAGGAVGRATVAPSAVPLDAAPTRAAPFPAFPTPLSPAGPPLGVPPSLGYPTMDTVLTPTDGFPGGAPMSRRANMTATALAAGAQAPATPDAATEGYPEKGTAEVETGGYPP